MKQDSFQFANTAYNLRTSQKTLTCLLPYLKPVQTVLDLGCGMGAWSAALESVKKLDLKLVDHPQLPVEQLLVSNKQSFEGINLDMRLPEPGRWDMVMCIEVLEHFSEKRAIELHNFICQSTDLVLFSAAIPGQGGIGHINCQRHSYWHTRFQSAGFAYFDGFKPELVHDETIPFWIRQNLFIYYKPKYAWLFKDIANYTPANFELIQSGMLRTDIGLKAWLKLTPKVFANFAKRLLKKA